jgi:O-antigen/teichoic acid export membrane protein
MTEPLGWRALLRGSAVIAVAMAVMNLGTYGFTLVAARVLGPGEYGAVGAVMGLLLVLNVVSLGLQATGARRVSAAPQLLEDIEADVLTATYKSAAAIGVLCLLAVPPVTWLLRLDSWLVAAMVAVTAVPMTVMGGQAGILQGERRWMPLAGVYLGLGLGRIGFGGLGLLLRPDTLGAMTGVAVGAVVPVLVGSAALRRTAARQLLPTGETRVGHSRRVLRELAHNSHALLAFFALSNIDVLVARVMLDDFAGGLYAGGLILAKAVLFLPQFVVVVAFPSMSEAGARLSMMLKALLTILMTGLAATGFAWLVPGLAVQFVGGAAYVGLERVIWAFAAIGTVWAMIQLLVYNVLARQARAAVLVVWAGLAAVLAIAPTADSMPFLVTAVLLVEGAVLLVLLLLAVPRGTRASGRPRSRSRST